MGYEGYKDTWLTMICGYRGYNNMWDIHGMIRGVRGYRDMGIHLMDTRYEPQDTRANMRIQGMRGYKGYKDTGDMAVTYIRANSEKFNAHQTFPLWE